MSSNWCSHHDLQQTWLLGRCFRLQDSRSMWPAGLHPDDSELCSSALFRSHISEQKSLHFLCFFQKQPGCKLFLKQREKRASLQMTTARRQTEGCSLCADGWQSGPRNDSKHSQPFQTRHAGKSGDKRQKRLFQSLWNFYQLGGKKRRVQVTHLNAPPPTLDAPPPAAMASATVRHHKTRGCK